MTDEVSNAVAAAKTFAAEDETIFGKILRKVIPCTFIYEDDKVCLFLLLYFHNIYMTQYFVMFVHSVWPSTM